MKSVYIKTNTGPGIDYNIMYGRRTLRPYIQFKKCSYFLSRSFHIFKQRSIIVSQIFKSQMNTKKVSFVSLLLMAAIILFVDIQPSFAQHNFYISIKGNDSWPGSKEQPFATFDAARNAVRAVLKRNGHDYGVTVWVNGGIYRFTKTFHLDSLDSGGAKAPVVYRAVPGEKVHIMGGPELPPSAFIHVQDEKILKHLTPNAQKHVIQVNLKALGITDYGELKQYGHSRPVVPGSIGVVFQ